MKFSKLNSTTYDAGTKTLKFSGQTGSGVPAAVEMPLEDENVFLAVMAARLYDGKPPPMGNGKTIVADQFTASFRKNQAGERSIAFTVRSGTVHLHYILPIQTSEPATIEQIKAHMKAMFELLAERDKRVTH
jgi:hypothetical protein